MVEGNLGHEEIAAKDAAEMLDMPLIISQRFLLTRVETDVEVSPSRECHVLRFFCVKVVACLILSFQDLLFLPRGFQFLSCRKGSHDAFPVLEFHIIRDAPLRCTNRAGHTIEIRLYPLPGSF